MKRTYLLAIMIFLILSSMGCGNHHSSSSGTTAFIVSDPAFDGDISLDTAGTYTITQGNTQSVFAGIDPASNVEYRAFLDFPLGGPGGIPVNAAIDSAFLDIVINNIVPQPLTGTMTIPIRIDLVSIQSLTFSDYNRTLQPALETTTITPPISQSDFLGEHISIDVTSLMTEAQRLGLADFQVRILEDLGTVTPGFIEINDTTTTSVNRGELAPQLQVNYH